VGKTSFANIIGSDLYGVIPIKITCNRSDSFRGIWEKAFAKVRFEKSKNGIGYIPNKRIEEYQLDLFLPEDKDISSLDVQQVLENLDSNLLFIFDEYDSIIDVEVLARMADTLKALSDNAPNVTIMLVGIAENVEGLIGSHPSTERCLRQVRMPKMSDEEVDAIIHRGLAHLQFSMAKNVRYQIVKMALGFPHFAHLLAKQACRAAVEDEQDHVGKEQYARGLQSSLERVDQSIRSSYQQATQSVNDKAHFETVLWACAEAPLDEVNTFSTRDVANEFSMIVKKLVKPQSLSYKIGKLCSTDRQKILERVKTGSLIRFRFRNPLFRVFVKMKYESLIGRSDKGVR
ncbi:MAG: hypothetical protein ACPG6P_13065, partial [Akkermansiaceae bacterium]